MKQTLYSVRRSKRAKRIRITVYHNGNVVVTGPADVSPSILERCVSDNISWITDKINFFKSFGNLATLAFFPDNYAQYRNQALSLIESRVRFYNEIYQFSYNKIYIKNQKTRWGSCSGKKNLSFNYRILFLPKKLQDYIIVHELCHLKELNHSKRFWLLVARVFPDYQNIRNELRTAHLQVETDRTTSDTNERGNKDKSNLCKICTSSKREKQS